MINVEYWFPVPLWFSTLQNINNNKLEKYCINLSQKETGRVLSNYGGWQSNDLYIDNCSDKELLKLANAVKSCVRECGTQINLSPNRELNLINFWINVNSKDNSNKPHNHPASIFSAVYYVSAESDSGKIVFEHPSHFMDYWWRSICEGDTMPSYNNVSVEPLPGKLVIFPSWLKHFVEPNNNSKPRISIAFNFAIDWI